MYWVVWCTVLALFVYFSIKLKDAITFLVTLYFCLFGLFLGFSSLPKIYKVNPDGTIKKEFAPLPWVKRSVEGGEHFRPHLDSTYVLNASESPILVTQVLYTDKAFLVGQPVVVFDIKKDTVRNRLLRFPTERVAPFKEAPMTIETGQVRGIEMMTVLALPYQGFECLKENPRYRLLKEVEDSYVEIY